MMTSKRVTTILMLAALVLTAELASTQESIDVTELDLVGPSRGTERGDLKFTVRPFDHPVRRDARGYKPTVASVAGGTLPTIWTPPVVMTWDFGDGSAPVSSGERVSALHRYADQGTYVVKVVASVEGEPFASGSYEVEVRNRGPRRVRITSVPDPSTPSTISLAAGAIDTEEDSLLYHWDFGDGASEEGEDLWQLSHQYLAPGRYTVRLTVRDEDGGVTEEEEDVEVIDAGEQNIEVDEVDDEEATEVVRSRLSGSLQGAPSSQLDTGIRSVYGLYVSATGNGPCKFMFTAWDDANLGFFLVQFDLQALSPEGSQYTFHRPNVVYSAEPDAEAYLRQKHGTGMPGLGSPLGRLDKLKDLMTQQAGNGTDSSLDSDGNSEGDADVDAQALPSVSPFGVKTSTGFGVEWGKATLTFLPGHSARGRLIATLVSSDTDFPRTLQLDADFALDLERAARKGWIRYEDCFSGGLKITSVSPADGAQHLRERRPWLQARFDKRLDPSTLHGSNVEVGYLDAAGNFQTAAGRILPDRYSVYFYPERDLRSGVRYQLRLRAAAEGIRGLDGSQLDDEDGDGWRTSSFWTHIDFTAVAGGNLSCHLFQATRDAPLVPEKPVIARIYASWPKDDEVAASEQVKAFDGKVIVGGDELKVSTTGHFVRPDLWEANGVRTSHAEHTTQVTGLVVPQSEELRSLPVLIDKSGSTGDRFRLAKDYRTLCPVRVWPHKPKLEIDVFALRIGPWEELDTWLADLPVARSVLQHAADYAWQLFPLHSITFSDVRTIVFEQDFPGIEVPPDDFGVTSWITNMKDLLRERSSADIVVLLGPHEMWGGGNTPATLRDGQGAIGTSIGSNPAHFSRHVFGLVHEIGHALELGHLPDIGDSSIDRSRLTELREALKASGQPMLFEGIEGFRMRRDGALGWNKSSEEGNQQNHWLVPLMFPGTVATDRAFIADHHYRQIQRFLQDLNW